MNKKDGVKFLVLFFLGIICFSVGAQAETWQMHWLASLIAFSAYAIGFVCAAAAGWFLVETFKRKP